MYHSVVDWNTLSGNSVDDKDLSEIYKQLTNEELYGENEFIEGYIKHNDEMQLDGICDLIFTSFYWAAVNGMDEIQLEDAYEKAFTAYDFGSATLEGTIKLLSYYLEKGHPYLFVKELIVVMLIRKKQYDIVSAFEEVKRSNISKYPLVEEISDPEKEIEYITRQGRYSDITYKEVNRRYIFLAGKDLKSGVVFDKKKIVKPSTFSDVNRLSSFVY
jgi:hypothetical protein